MGRDPADRVWFVEPREVAIGPPDEATGETPTMSVLVSEDVENALAEITPILLRIGGGIALAAERVRLDDDTYTTSRIIIRWQPYVGRARRATPAAENGAPPPEPAPEPAPEPPAEPAPEPEPEPQEAPVPSEG